MHIISREEWGAAPPNGTMVQVPWSQRLGCCVHYTAGNKTDTPAELQAYAQNTLGYVDMHYNMVVDYLGNAYEGRGWTISAAHSEGENRTHVGISFIGQDADVTPAAEATIAWLIGEANRLAGRKLPELKGHKEMPGAQTSCPGQRLMNLVERIRSGEVEIVDPELVRMLEYMAGRMLAVAYMEPTFSNWPTPSGGTAPEAGMPVPFTAWATGIAELLEQAPGGGVTAAQVREIVREEIRNALGETTLSTPA